MTQQEPQTDAAPREAPTTAAARPDKAPRSGRHWVAIIVLMLVGHVVAVTVLIVSSSGDPSHQVIPDYYKKAVRWDQHMAQQRRNAELGWSLDVSMKRLAARGGERVGAVEVAVALRDRLGRALRGADVKLRVFHKARAGRMLRASLAEGAAGHYSAKLRMVRLGLWQLDFVVEHGGARFTQRLDRELLSRVGKLAHRRVARGAE
ncbi:MAG: FixH family protein [Myxococcales bacterium]|nr:FixH family protein [Myxococcales bacterium]